MKTESKKEILTKEKCRIDLTRPQENNRHMLYLWAMLCLFALFFALMLWNLLSGWARYVVVSPFVLILLVAVVGNLVIEMNRRRRNRVAQAREFHVVREVLVKVTKDAYCHFPRRHDSGLRDLLVFTEHKFFLEYQPYYRWSSLYSMSADGVYNTALPGDTFYLVIYDDDPEQKPVMVYNAKFFEYNEEA